MNDQRPLRRRAIAQIGVADVGAAHRRLRVVMMFRVLPALVGANVGAEDRVVQRDIERSPEADELVVADVPFRAHADVHGVASRDAGPQLFFGTDHDVPRQVGDAWSQHDRAVRIRNRRMRKVEALRQRHVGAVDGRDRDPGFAPGGRRRLLGIGEQQLISDLPVHRSTRQSDVGGACRKAVRRLEERRLAASDACLMAEVDQPVAPLERILRGVDRHISNDELDAAIAWNRIGLGPRVDRPAGQVDQVGKAHVRIARA